MWRYTTLQQQGLPTGDDARIVVQAALRRHWHGRLELTESTIVALAAAFCVPAVRDACLGTALWPDDAARAAESLCTQLTRTVPAPVR